MTQLNILTYLSIAILFGLLSGKLMKLIRLPNVTGYIIIGLLVGPYCFNLFPLEVIESLDIIPSVALGFIAFSIGSEFKLSYLKKVGKTPVIIAILEGMCAVLIVDAVLLAIGTDVTFTLALGAIAAATAPAATLMVVRQYKAKGPVTETLLPVVAIDDAVALIAFGLSVAIAKALSSNGQASFASTLIGPIVEIFGALLFGAILGIVFRLLLKWFLSKGNRLCVTVAMIFLCVGVSKLLGFSELLACMAMSSILVNTSSESDEIFAQLDIVTPPIFMLFFFISGAELDITIIPTVGLIGVIYVVFRVIGKVFGAYAGAKICHSEPVVQKWIGFTLIPQAGVAIGLAGVAMTVVPSHGAQIRAIILSATVIYELIGPVITKWALTKAGEIHQ